MNVIKSLRMLLPATALLIASSASGVSAETVTYEQQLRAWTSQGYRVQAGAVYLTSLQRTGSLYGHTNAEVAGVQLVPDGVFAAEPPSYEEQLRRFASDGYRIQSGWVSTSAIVRR